MGTAITWILLIIIALMIAIIVRQQMALRNIESKMKKLEAMILTNSKALHSTMNVVKLGLQQEIQREEDAKKQDTKEKQ